MIEVEGHERIPSEKIQHFNYYHVVIENVTNHVSHFFNLLNFNVSLEGGGGHSGYRSNCM